jgi:hypothetical protein
MFRGGGRAAPMLEWLRTIKMDRPAVKLQGRMLQRYMILKPRHRSTVEEWTCDDCGMVHDRDVNAAKNILRCGLTALAEGTSTSRLGSSGLQAGG